MDRLQEIMTAAGIIAALVLGAVLNYITRKYGKP